MNQQNNQQMQQQMSKEDLTRTQVLNLQALEEAANYERKTSKKPAITLASIGLFAIFMGIVYNPIVGMISGNNIDETVTPSNHIAQKVQDETLTCVYQLLNNADGTDTAITYTMIFDASKLQTYTKVFTADVTVGNAIGTTTTQNYLAANLPYDGSITGYIVKSEATSTGMKTTSSIDLTKLDKNQVPETHKLNNITNPEFDLNTDKTAIQTYLQSAGYTCR